MDDYVSQDLLDSVLSARSVAVIGASNNPEKVGGRPIQYLQNFGYDGHIYPVNPGRKTVQGLPAYAALQDIQDQVDMVVVAVGKELVLPAIRECVDKGVKAAVILSSGFGELGAQGESLQEELVELAHRHNMRLIGPNSQGIANFSNGLVTNFSSMLKQVEPLDGPVAIVSQSGATSGTLYTLVRKKGVGVRYVCATGNEADITTAELALGVLADDSVRLLLVYVENMANADCWRRLGAVAKAKGVPVLVVKSGTTAKGATTAQSHTGALASEDGIVDAFFRKIGVGRCHDLTMMADAAQLYLSSWSQPAEDTVIISNSGAACVMATDAAVTLGLPLAELSASATSAIRQLIPGTINCNNPIDLTTAVMTDSSLLGSVLDCLSKQCSHTILFSLPVAGDGYDLDRIANDLLIYKQQTGATILVTGTVDAITNPFSRIGIPSLISEHRAIEVLTQIYNHKRLVADVTTHTSTSMKKPVVPNLMSQSSYNEVQSLELLSSIGLPIPDYHVCHSAEDAVQAWKAFEGHAVLKGLSSDIPHKSEHGLVFLALPDAAAVRAAYSYCKEQVRVLDAKWQGCVVSRRINGRLEIALGLKHDPVFGPVLLVGEGGKYVEALPDFQLLLPPLNEAEIRRALYKLRIAPLFAGVRGEPALALKALITTIQRLGDASHTLLQSLHSLDINPVMVGSEEEGVCVVDALLEA